MDTSSLTRYIRDRLSYGSLPTLREMLDFMYHPSEGEHVQSASLMGELRILHTGCLFAEFDIYNPSGKLYRLDMWHAGAWAVTFDSAHEVKAVRFSDSPRFLDYPHAYRFDRNCVPLMLQKYVERSLDE